MDALVALSEYGAEVLRDEAGIEAERVHVIPHGPLDYLTRLDDEAPLPPELAAVEGPVVAVLRPDPPLQGRRPAARGLPRSQGRRAVGRRQARSGWTWASWRRRRARCESTVRFVPRFVADAEIPALFRRADLVVLPHRDAEQSGVLFTALAFGKAILMSDVGGFPEVAALGAGRTVPRRATPAPSPQALGELLADPAARERLGAAARAAGDGPVLVGRDRRAAHRPLRGPAAAIIAGHGRSSRSPSGPRVGLLVYTHVGLSAAARGAARAAPDGAGAPASGEPAEPPTRDA